MKGEEEEEEVDQVVAAVEVGLVLDVNLVPPAEAQAAVAAVAAVQVQALGSTLERRKQTPILVHPTPNNNLEDPKQVSKGASSVIFLKIHF